MKTTRTIKVIGNLCLALALGGVCLFSAHVQAAAGINKQIPFYGVLKHADGTLAADGNYDVVLKIYTAPSGGSAQWTGNYTSGNGNPVAVKDGNFTVMLGSGTGNALTVDFTQDTYYVGITVGTDSEMTPRQQLGAAAYAFNADMVDGIHLPNWTGSTNLTTLGTISAGSIPYALISGSPTLGTIASLNTGTLSDGKYCTYASGTGIVCNSSIPNADATHNGLLTSGDWSTFNGKENQNTNLDAIANGTWTGSKAITTVGTLTAGSIPYSLITGAPASQNTPITVSPNSTVVFEGDSLTSGFGLTKSADNTTSCKTSVSDATCLDWPSQLILMSTLNGKVSAKYIPATAGNRITDMQSRYAASVHSLSPAVTGNPGILFMWGGSNDYGADASSAATIESRLTTYWATAKADGWKVVAFTIMRRGDAKNISGESGRIATNAWIRGQRYAGVYDYLIDVDHMINDPFNTNLFQSDNIHINQSGHYELAKMVNSLMFTDEVPVLSDNYSYDASKSVTRVGFLAGLSNTGSNNLFAGNFAGYNSGSGGLNVILGDNAGNTSTASGSVIIGQQTGQTITGNANTCIGYATCPTAMNGTWNVGLGTGADFGTSVSDSVQLGRGKNSTNSTAQYQAHTFMDSNGYLYSASYTPATSSAACTKGAITWDANYVYTCVATNTWERAALSTW